VAAVAVLVVDVPAIRLGRSEAQLCVASSAFDFATRDNQEQSQAAYSGEQR